MSRPGIESGCRIPTRADVNFALGVTCWKRDEMLTRKVAVTEVVPAAPHGGPRPAKVSRHARGSHHRSRGPMIPRRTVLGGMGGMALVGRAYASDACRTATPNPDGGAR